MTPSCPVCRSDRVRCAFVKEQVPYFFCRACRFGFAKPPTNPNLENRLEDFEDAYLQYFRPDPVDDRNFAALCAWMSRFGRLTGAALLDAGCGSGKLVRYFRAHAIDAQGLEPSAALFEHFLSADAFFTHGDLDRFCAQGPRTFNVVTAFDVLEHVEDPVHFVEKLASLIPTGGLLFLSTPDVGSVAANVLGKYWHFFCPYHLSYFSRRNLTAVARRLGLKLLHVSRRGRYRSVRYAVQYFFDFLLRRPAPGFVKRLNGLYLPINIYDTMYLCFTKTAAASGSEGQANRIREAA
ncbi:MAG TPA: class I SAM-dependent methyltransferase [Gemmataceae bacterium]|jgi:2-polyprenyl-3-methyl-5-hydroxy-6-metoxy-1,4-benzoquinol methylase|nr:class I SAM-dependent methyltransferase [Gemmataceae bacterium]